MTDTVKPAPDGVVISRELLAFLCGDGPLDGHYFGEKPEHERGSFWWRKALRAAENAALEQAGEPVDRIAQAIYEMNPCGEQQTDLDGRPTGPGAEIPWSDMVEYDPEYHAACMEAARKVAAVTQSRVAAETVGLRAVEGANSHVFDLRILIGDSDDEKAECIAFANEPWAGRIIAALATRSQPDPQSRANEVEERKFYLSDWTISQLLEARSDGLVTDDGEAWRYRYTHKDAKGKYDLLYRPQSRGQAFDGEGEAERMREALEWYGEQARLCRLIHSEGDAGRHALQDDGGKRAQAALSSAKRGEEG